MHRWFVASVLLAGCTEPGGTSSSADEASSEAEVTGADASTSSSGDSGDSTTGETDSETTATTSGSTDASTTDETSGDETSDGDTDDGPGGPPQVLFPRRGILPEEVAIIENVDDPLSGEIAAAYATARGIPSANVISLSTGTSATMTAEDFASVGATLAAELSDDIQALVLTSMQPDRVGCMGASAAFALGFDPQYCQAGPPCLPTAPVDYYDSSSTRPWTDHGLRPTMILAATSLEDATALIDRGVAADGTHPTAEGYFIRTTDMARAVRYADHMATVSAFDRPDALSLTYVDNADGSGSNVLTDVDDVLFYFTGLATVPDIDTCTYLPGAVADHLTSFGGRVPDSGQMTILRWLEAGATASYGTAHEPCNYETKFPRTSVFVPHYFRGETVVEAYWKSVNWPGEGNFVGEPLARPYADGVVDWDMGSQTLTITTTVLIPGETYAIESANDPAGPWTEVQSGITVAEYRFETVVVEGATAPWYRIVAQ